MSSSTTATRIIVNGLGDMLAMSIVTSKVESDDVMNAKFIVSGVVVRIFVLIFSLISSATLIFG